MLHPRRILITLATVLIPVLSCDSGTPTENGQTPASSYKSQASYLLQNPSRDKGKFTDQFRLQDCQFSSVGTNPYFPLTPGSVRVLTGVADGVKDSLQITTLNQTLVIDGVTTRIVEERDFEDGELIEVSRNYFATCAPNNSVFYFGEDVDNYENGQIVNHGGSWRHGVNGARAGLQMAGLPLLGARYFQEVAPGVALDQAETIQLDAKVETPFGHFTDALLSQEGTPLEPGTFEYKWYVAGVGLVRDAEVRLVALQ